MRYTYSSEGRMVVVLCGLIALVGSSPWITESWVCRCRRRRVVCFGSCTVLFDDVTYSLCTWVVCVYRRIESRYVKVGDSELRITEFHIT